MFGKIKSNQNSVVLIRLMNLISASEMSDVCRTGQNFFSCPGSGSGSVLGLVTCPAPGGPSGRHQAVVICIHKPCLCVAATYCSRPSTSSRDRPWIAVSYTKKMGEGVRELGEGGGWRRGVLEGRRECSWMRNQR